MTHIIFEIGKIGKNLPLLHQVGTVIKKIPGKCIDLVRITVKLLFMIKIT